jgi:H+-translocating NAD(P) transhydrogenase subunit alpha
MTAGPGLMGFITIFVLAAFVGYEVISKVPSILHTPLMSGSNAIHGIILVGTMLVLGQAHGVAQLTLGFLAVVLATLNVVGGFVVTDRMLEMFKSKPADRGTSSGTGRASQSGSSSAGDSGSQQDGSAK